MTVGRAPYTVPDLLLAAVNQDPSRPAVIDGDERLTYGELLAAARRQAASLAVAGVEPGDRVALILPRSASAIAAFFGTALLGAVVVPVNDRLTPAQVAQIIAHARPRAVVTDTHHEQLLRDVTDNGVVRLVVNHAPARAPTPDLRGASAIGRDLAALMFTSGSTGPPKGVMLTHENLVWGAVLVADYLGLTSDDLLVTALPLSFDYGLNQVLSAAHVGAAVVIERSAHPAALCRTIERYGVTGVAGVPFLWQQLSARHSPFFSRPLPSLRYVSNSGGSLHPEILGRLRERKPSVDVFLMYGLTEAFRSTYLEPSEVDRRPTSIGKAIPNTEVLVLDEHGAPCSPGEIGELVHRGPTVAAGYWRDPEATGRVFRRRPTPSGLDETVVHSGDLVWADADGYLYFVGRRDGQLKVRGIRVNLDEIEVALRRCDAVDDVIAYVDGLVAPGDDPVISAAIVLASGVDSPAALERFCRNEIPGHMRPVCVHAVTEIPRTPHGKPDRGAAQVRWGRES